MRSLLWVFAVLLLKAHMNSVASSSRLPARQRVSWLVYDQFTETNLIE
ncbi:MAG: hypothetical protein ACRENK_17020 [Gemmatimonadaceae bacterium]